MKIKTFLSSLACLVLGMTMVYAQRPSQEYVLPSPYKVDNQTFELLKNLSESNLGGGSIYLFTTTHQDLGWLDNIQTCTINRDTMWLTPFINRLGTDPDFKMDIEQSSVVMEYIHRHPEKKALVKKYLNEGRICVGASYVQTYEDMYFEESLTREFYYGKKWLKDNFDYSPSSYFNVDVPGRTLQMPQMMKKAGIENLVLSRQERGLSKWASPDGSKVRIYSPGHYIYFYNVLGKPDDEAIAEMAREAVLWYKKFNDVKGAPAVMPAMLNYEFIWNQAPVENCVPFITKWNNLTAIQNEQGEVYEVNLPKFKYAIADEFFSALDQSTTQIPEIHGERPNVWLYIHCPSHSDAMRTSRQADALLPATEALYSCLSMVENSYVSYPEARLRDAWMDKIYPDHGWGGMNGVENDLLFGFKYSNALSEAEDMSDKAVARLAAQVKTKGRKGIPVIVYNSLADERKEYAETSISLEKGFAKNVEIRNNDGELVSSHLSDVVYYEDGSIKNAELSFYAEAPQMGYVTYYMKPCAVSKASSSAFEAGYDFENAFYKVSFVDGGIEQIYDKELGRNIVDASKFLFGEVITLKSKGNGAGEFDAIQPTEMVGFDRIANGHAVPWKLAENNPMYCVYSYRSEIRNAVIEQRVKIYNEIKKIDFDVDILNFDGELYREYRMMFPTNMADGKVAYEVPFGVLHVGEDEMPGAAGERYYVENKLLHPRGISRWFSASDAKATMTLSSSAGVVDFIDPTPEPSQNTILQPILLASRRSCHSKGIGYFQKGDHHYNFSLTTSAPDEVASVRFGAAVHTPLFVAFNPMKAEGASLAEENSFLNVDNENVVLSVLKKSEDGESLIVRLYNLSDKNEKVNLTLSEKVKKIVKVNLIEEDIEEVSGIELGPKAIETYRLIR